MGRTYAKIRDHVLPQLIPPNVRLLVAVSGGPDSIALAHILWRYAQEESHLNLSLILTHVNHGLRPEAGEEAQMVENRAQGWGLPCIIHEFDARSYALHSGQSVEAAAREWRYARWREDMAKEKCDLLVTAHHLGDQAETVLYRLLRGSGTAGLAGIYPCKEGIIRPLLTVTKKEILAYCHQEGLAYAWDSSNEEPVYIRNKIRLELLPELEQSYNPKVLYALGRTAQLMRWDEDYINNEVSIAWEKYCTVSQPERVGLKLDIFKEPPAILTRLLRKAAALVTREPRGLAFVYVEKIIESQGKLGWRQNLPGLVVKSERDEIFFIRPDSFIQETATNMSREVYITEGEWTEIKELKVEVGIFRQPLIIGDQDGKIDTVSLGLEEILKGNVQLACRTRRSCDTMWFQKVGHKLLKKVFQEERIPASQRDHWPLIVWENEVLWIPGVRRSDRFRPSDAGEKLYCIVKYKDLTHFPNSL